MMSTDTKMANTSNMGKINVKELVNSLRQVKQKKIRRRKEKEKDKKEDWDTND